MKKLNFIIFSVMFLVLLGASVMFTSTSSYSASLISFDNFSCSLLEMLSGCDPSNEADKIFDTEEDLTKIDNTLMVDSQTFSNVTKTKVILSKNSCEIETSEKKVLLNANDNIILLNDCDIISTISEPRIVNNKFYFSLTEVADCLGFEVKDVGNKVILSNPYQTKRLIINSAKNLDCKGAKKKVEGYNNLHIFEYETEEQCRSAYEYYNSLENINWVCIDSVYSINDEINSLKNNKVNKNININKGNSNKLSNNKNNIYTNNNFSLTEEDNLTYTTWGASAMGVENYSNYLLSSGIQLNEVIIAILDTGLDSDHSWFEGRVSLGGKNFSTSQSSSNCEYEDVNGHGTHIAGTIVDLTLDNVKILPIKVMNDNGEGYFTNILNGLEYVIGLKNGTITINSSSSGNDNNFVSNLIAMNLSFGNSSSSINSSSYNAYNNKLSSAYASGLLPVVAAGNDGINVENTSPANISCAITVAAVRKAGQSYYRPHWSNWGSFIDVSAPGEDIVSACVGGGVVSLDGTSMASPHVASVVALLYSGGNSMQQIEKILQNTAIDLGAVGKDNYYGNGLVNIEFAYADLLDDTVIFKINGVETEENFFSSSFNLTLSCNTENSVIYYTLDGTEPLLTNKNTLVYTKEIGVFESALIRARAFVLNNANEVICYSKETSHIFIVNNTDIQNAYTISDDGELLSYNGLFSDIIVPESYNGKIIKSIGQRAFIEANPVSVTLPKTVTTIGKYAFYGCSNLVNVVANNVTTIGMYSFFNCDKLTKVTDNEFENVKIIDKYAFSNCGAIEDISLSIVELIDYNAFCMRLSTPEQLRSLYLPNVKIIGDLAFYGCNNLSNIYLPNVEIIGSKTFLNCAITSSAYALDDSVSSNNTTLSLPKVKYLGSRCFEDNSGIRAIDLPEVLLISNQSFYGCIRLINASIPKVKEIASLAFAFNNFVTLNMPSVEVIGSQAFFYCDNLTTFFAPKLKDLKTQAFYNCRSLQKVNLPSIESIEKEVFYNVTEITEVKLSQFLKYISFYAFNKFNAGCVFYIYSSTPAKEYVENVKLTNGGKINYVELSQNEDSFAYEIINDSEIAITGVNIDISNLVVPSFINGLPVTTIKTNAFKNYSNITSLNLVNVEIIEDNAFENCVNLKSVYLPEILFIGNRAFCGCNNLTSVNIETAINIGTKAFFNCNNLIQVKLINNDVELSEYSLGYLDNGVNSNFNLIGVVGKVSEYASSNNINFHNIFTNLEDFKYYFNFYDNNGKTEIYISLVDSYLTGSIIVPETYTIFSEEENRNITYNITKIGDNAFQDCFLITNIILPSSIITLGSNAFFNCISLRNINLENIESMGVKCFSHCENLQSVNLENLSFVPSQAFSYCYSLKYVELNNATIISDQAFYFCSALDTVISPLVEKIGYAGFSNNYMLKSINLNNVTLLGSYLEEEYNGATILGSVFQNCYEIDQFIYLPKIVELGDQLFDGSNVENLVIGSNFNFYDRNAQKLSIIKNITIYGYDYSFAKTYSNRHGNKFIAIDEFAIVSNTAKNKSCLKNEECFISVNARGFNLKYQWYKINGTQNIILENENSNVLKVDTSTVGTNYYGVSLTNWDGQILSSNNYSVYVMPSYEIEIINSDKGKVETNPSNIVEVGGSVTIKVTANEGYYVSKILVDNVELSSVQLEEVLENGYTFSNVYSNHSFEVQFSIYTYTITATCGENGVISGSQAIIEHGGSYTFTFIPESNYHISDVLIDGESIGKCKSYTFNNVTKNHTLYVTFAENGYNIILKYSNSNFGSLLCEKPLEDIKIGEARTFTINVKDGYYVNGVKCNGTEISVEDDTFTIANISADIVLEIDFKKINDGLISSASTREILILLGIIIGAIIIVGLPLVILSRRNHKRRN